MFYSLVFLIAGIVLIRLITNIFTEPSHDRDWSLDQAVLPHIQFDSEDKNQVHISNIRNFTYSSTTAYEVNYYDKTFDIQSLDKVWYIVEPFSGIPGSAHTMLSFEFATKTTTATATNTVTETKRDFLAISVEIRKEKGESFHPIKGLFNQYEIMYVIADEKDAIQLRTNHRKDLVYMYPVRADKQKVQALFLSMLEAAQQLHDTPEFYNTITNTCTTNIVSHVNKVTPGRVPWLNLAVLFPASSDKLALSLGLLDTDLPIEQAREYFLINDRAMEFSAERGGVGDGVEGGGVEDSRVENGDVEDSRVERDFSVRIREFGE